LVSDNVRESDCRREFHVLNFGDPDYVADADLSI
jgi:hypothetical protein